MSGSRLASASLAAPAILGLAGIACGGSTASGPAPVVTEVARAPGAALFRKNDIVAYRIKDADGRALGRTHSTYLVSEDGFPQVVTRVELAGGDKPLQVEHATTFRADLSPVHYKRLSSTDGRYELRFLGETLELATDRGIQKVKAKPVQVAVVPEEDLMMLALAIDDERLQPGAAATMDVYSPETRESDPWPVQAHADAAGRTVVLLPGGKAELDASGRLTRLEIRGRIYEAELPPGPAPQVRYDPPLAYQKPKAGRWTDRPLTVEVQGGALAGVISVPSDRASWPKKLAPVVVFVSRRGDQDRYGFQGSIDTGTWEIADHFADHGFAVVRLDDRGVGQSVSQIEPKDRGLNLAVADVLAVLRALEREPEIDPERVVLVGHGLGALPAMMVAGRAPLAGLLLIGAPHHPLAMFRSMAELEKRGDVAEAERRMRSVAKALAGDQATEKEIGLDRVRPHKSERALIVEIAGLDLGAEIAKVRSPVAVVQGLRDIEVSWRDDAQPLVEALKKAVGKERVKLLAFDHVDHLLKSEPRESSLARYADRSRRVDPPVLDAIVEWATEKARASAAAPGAGAGETGP